MTNPDKDLCICHGSGTYKVAKTPKYKYNGQIDWGKSFFKSETLKCEYHATGHPKIFIPAAPINYETLWYLSPKIKLPFINIPNTGWDSRLYIEAEPVHDIRPLAPRYPDGWPEEELKQWCDDNKYCYPSWLRTPVKDWNTAWDGKAYTTYGSVTKFLGGTNITSII